MDFYTALGQAKSILRDRGRVSHRALQWQLGLEDGLLEAIVDELVLAERVAVNEDDRVLIWRGPVEPEAPAALGAGVAERSDSAEPDPAGLGAERRQLTLLFCDLVGSTALSERLDAEDLRRVIREYQKCCDGIIAAHGGFIARYMGDGLLVYFGYPQADEHDAERAVHAALEIIRSVNALRVLPDLKLRTRIGIATGEVVVGDVIGQGVSSERAVVGRTPNIAARLQGLAPPDGVVISDATHRLVGTQFDCEDLGDQVLKGLTSPIRAWRVAAPREVENRFEAALALHGVLPMVERTTELHALIERWDAARHGQGRALMVVGEPGIGKSRLILALRERTQGTSHHLLRCYCGPHHQSSALHPVIVSLARWIELSLADEVTIKQSKIRGFVNALGLDLVASVPILSALLSVPPSDEYPPLPVMPALLKERTLALLVSMVERLADEKPVLILFEDVHWIDPTSRQLIERLLCGIGALPVLLVMSAREGVGPDWRDEDEVETMTLGRLSAAGSKAIVAELTSRSTLPAEVVRHIVSRTDGIPLFVEEVTKSVLEATGLEPPADTGATRSASYDLSIPTTIHDSLMARLDRLGYAKGLAQTGAVIGRAFSRNLLEKVARLEPSRFASALDRLCEAGLLYPRGHGSSAGYVFKHALVQDAAYQSLLRDEKKRLHAHIAEVLITEYAALVADEPEHVARHYAAAEMVGPALDYWQKAGDRALQRSANAEAIGHLKNGLELIGELPDATEQGRRELGLQLSLGSASIAHLGYTDRAVEAAFTRAESLCDFAGGPAERFWVLMGLHLYDVVRGDIAEAKRLAGRMHALAEVGADLEPPLMPNARIALGSTHFLAGEFEDAVTELEAAASTVPSDDNTYLMRTGIDLRVLALSFGSLALWHRGFQDRAERQALEAIELARTMAHPHTEVAAYIFAGAELHHYLDDGAAVARYGRRIVDISSELGFMHWLPEGHLFAAWGEQRTSEDEASADTVRFEELLEQHVVVANTYFVCQLCDMHMRRRDWDEARRVVDRGIKVSIRQGPRFWDAELYRLKGTIALAARDDCASTDAVQVAHAAFQQAIDLARSQGSLSLELRASVSLGELLRTQGRAAEARRLVEACHGQFTEGFERPDLVAARALLESLPV